METTISAQNSRLDWIKRWSKSVWWITGILLLASFLRLFRIADYMTFLGDEGRDVLIVKHLLEGDVVGLGPTASVGGFFLGPIYYYFMAPFLWLFRFDPVGPAVMVTLFGIATVFLVYWVGRVFFNEKAGLFASGLYAVSPLVIAYSRSSWNPNLMPFFSLLTLFVLYLAVEKRSWKLFVASGLLLGITMQLHYLATFLVVVMAAFVFVQSFRKVSSLFKRYLVILFGFLIGLSPFLAFEVTHGFPNIVTLLKFMFGTTGETGFAGAKFTAIVGDVFFRLFGRLVMRFPPPEQVSISGDIPLSSWHTSVILVGLLSVLLLIRRLNRKTTLLLLWLIFGVFLFGFYKKPIYDYYFGFMFPLPFLLVGNFLSSLYTNVSEFARYIVSWFVKSEVDRGQYEFSRISIFGKVLTITVFVGLLWLNLDGMPFRYEPNRQLAQVRLISEFVLEKAEDKPFNFALITEQNSDHAYRYFFEINESPPVTIESFEKDPSRHTVTDQLLIVCEDPNCKPLGHSLWEVAGFGQAEVEGEWPVSVVKVYKLIHFRSEN